jgi:putative protein kinase ArgK-like GTPase of G3E family
MNSSLNIGCIVVSLLFPASGMTSCRQLARHVWRLSVTGPTPPLSACGLLAVSLVDDLQAGVGGMLFITGEPGIGKSRLLAELRERFDGRWLEGR